MQENNKEILTIITARGGSKGVPRKNIKELYGKPLVSYAIEASLNSKLSTRTMVSTEDEEISEVAKSLGAEVPFLRPQSLAEDNIHSVFAIIDAVEKLREIEGYSPAGVIMLLPTAPFTTSKHLDASIELFFRNNRENVMSVMPFGKPVTGIRIIEDGLLIPLIKTDNYNLLRQQCNYYYVNAAIYIASPENLTKDRTYHAGRIHPYMMTQHESVDINTQIDFDYAEFLMAKEYK